jgi:hypothetical protein
LAAPVLQLPGLREFAGALGATPGIVTAACTAVARLADAELTDSNALACI